jgi:hypothetical protein
MDKKLWIPILLGVGVLGYVWYRQKQKEKNAQNDPSLIVAEATQEEKKNFSPAFLAQYDIVMPPNQASKAVKAAAAERQAKRTERELKRMAKKKPVRI